MLPFSLEGKPVKTGLEAFVSLPCTTIGNPRGFPMYYSPWQTLVVPITTLLVPLKLSPGMFLGLVHLLLFEERKIA